MVGSQVGEVSVQNSSLGKELEDEPLGSYRKSVGGIYISRLKWKGGGGGESWRE